MVIEFESVKTRISASAHPSATGIGRVSGLVSTLPQVTYGHVSFGRLSAFPISFHYHFSNLVPHHNQSDNQSDVLIDILKSKGKNPSLEFLSMA